MQKKGSFNFDKVISRLERQKRDLPKKIGNQAVIFFQSNFQRQGFLDSSREAWPQRKKNKQSGRAILIKSGALRRDIRLHSANFHKIVISTSLPYARIHNEGGTIQKKESTKVLHFRNTDNDWNKKTGKYNIGTKFSKAKKAHYAKKVSIGAHVINMPKRQFMGKSNYLDKQLMFLIKQDMDKLFR